MKNKIKRISKGDFETVQPEIRFSQTRIVMRISEGGVYEGSFTILNGQEGEIRGLVYPSSYRMQCKEQGFEGNPVEIHYTFDGEGMLPGDVEEGKFSIVCNGGEFEIAYTAVVEKPFVMTEYGKIQNMKDFKKLAMTDFGEAQKLFRSKMFGELLKYEDARITSLYSNMRKWALDEQAMEEFLVGTKLKEKIYLLFPEEEKEFPHLFESTKEAVIVSKNTWGYLPIKVRAEGDFLEVLKKEISTDDFVGMNYYLEYIVNVKKLHGGNNFGKIYVETPYETIGYPVTVHQDFTHTEHHGEEGLMFGSLLKSYMSCICGRLNLESWMNQGVALVKELRELSPKNEMYELLLAHVFIRGGKLEEGQWILDNHNHSRFNIGKKAEIGAYYMFLSALVRKDEAYTKRVSDELNKLYTKNPASWQILCMILNLDPKYRNYGERLVLLQKHFENGAKHNQILPYIEAYICYQEKSSLLKKLGDFELKILNFATKYRIITEELALYTANLASQEKVYNENLCQILIRSYKLYEDPMILSAICTLLIKGNKTGKQYFPWYQKAIDSEMKLAQLYEHYMMSADDSRIKGPFPRSVLLYFSHGMTMDYKKTALLYANILTYEDEDSKLFAAYRHKMEAFAWNQLMKRHINENLRIIYKRFCSEPDNDVEHMKAIYDISNSYHVKTKAPNIQYVLVIEKDGRISQRVAYSEEGAQVIIYNKASRLVWEADDGRHYTDSIPYEMKRLFYESHFVEMYKEKEALLENNEKEKKLELNYENIRLFGMDSFEDEQVFRFLSKDIREEGEEDDFKLYLAFELLKRGQYDKVTLTYLANYYCGATKDMKQVWRTAREYEVKTHNLAERIITQMLFSETLFKEEEIFIDYYNSGAYFRLKLGYLAYVSQEYVVKNRHMKEEIVKIILKEFKEEENLADICKIAVLKFYAEHPYAAEEEDMIRSFLQELCEKQLVFPFYLRYKEAWLREVMLYDKEMICYQTKEDGKVKLTYKLEGIQRDAGKSCVEQLIPMYANIYVKQFVLYDSETLKFSIKECNGRKVVHEENGILKKTKKTAPVGKFGKLNAMDNMNYSELEEAMKEYRLEENLAGEIFKIN